MRAFVITLLVVCVLAKSPAMWPTECVPNPNGGDFNFNGSAIVALDWDDQGTHFVALNLTDGNILCEVAYILDVSPFGIIGPSQMAAWPAGGIVYSVLEDPASGNGIIYSINVSSTTFTKLCVSSPLAWTLAAHPTTGQLYGSGMTGDTNYGVWQIDMKTCAPTIISEIDITGMDQMNTNAVDFDEGKWYIQFRPGDSDEPLLYGFSLRVNHTTLTPITWAGGMPGHYYTLEALVTAPKASGEGESAAPGFYTYFVDDSNGTTYWGSLEIGHGHLDLISVIDDQLINLMLGGTSRAFQTSDGVWSMLAFGFSDTPYYNRVYSLGVDTGELLSITSSSVVSSVWQIAYMPQSCLPGPPPPPAH